MTAQTTFDPSRYLTKVGNADYLEVKWRLVWLRETHPEATVDTELVSHSGQEAVFRARVAIPGGGSATGWGSEAANDFRDYLEKAETKALGRALAALGFGTQFCPDFDFGAAAGKVVDTPIDFASTRGRRIAEAKSGSDNQTPHVAQAATPRQLKFMEAVAREAGLSDDELRDEIQRIYGRPAHELSRRDASSFIERLQNRRASLDLAS
jgi:hypothetical protein